MLGAPDERRQALGAADVDVPDLAAGGAVDEHGLGLGKEIGRALVAGIDPEAPHVHFEQVVGAVGARHRAGAEVAAGALERLLREARGDVHARAGRVEANGGAATLHLPRDPRRRHGDGLERVVHATQVIVAREQLRRGRRHVDERERAAGEGVLGEMMAAATPAQRGERDQRQRGERASCTGCGSESEHGASRMRERSFDRPPE